MNNSRAILTIDPSENITLTLQSNPGVGLQWHFTRGAGANGSGFFTVQYNGDACLVCRDNQRARILMIIEGIAARAPEVFPFLMEDQNRPRTGTLNLLVGNLFLNAGSYGWRVEQVVP